MKRRIQRKKKTSFTSLLLKKMQQPKGKKWSSEIFLMNLPFVAELQGPHVQACSPVASRRHSNYHLQAAPAVSDQRTEVESLLQPVSHYPLVLLPFLLSQTFPHSSSFIFVSLSPSSVTPFMRCIDRRDENPAFAAIWMDSIHLSRYACFKMSSCLRKNDVKGSQTQLLQFKKLT